ncbi:hypothetical protein EJ03DRAFT_67810 [Teratosphaeria nubilosa]|uniref:Uncharacterized protein n=1 Tax=Teratosphaeria nubilosa TaxID=161662 RepID=A0A6G1LE44_9PEZI|nr:hypothetical protein EJ03DRAFT_67810 [Teratosphaeria nubilosa]
MRLRPPFGKRSQTLVEDESKGVKTEPQATSTGNGSSSRKQPRRAATSPALQLHQRDTVQKQSKKRTMQDFFRSLRPFNAAAWQMPAKAQNDHRSRVSKPHASSSRRNSRHALPHDPSRSRSRRSFDISDDVLDRLMGPPKSVKEVGGRDSIQSDQFLLKQRIKASSRKASANGNLASSGLTQAQRDRRVLSAEEVDQLLSGTPCFSVIDGRPRVTSKGDDEVSGADWSRLGHETFSLCTLDERVNRKRDTREEGTQEVPNMLSANGLDPGTVGFEHFLQVPLADSNALPDELDCFERRRLLVNKADQVGLREVSVEALIDRLVELRDLRVLQHKHEEDGSMFLNDRRIEEMGEDLFRRLVDAELGISAAGTGSVTMRTQVEALQKVLNEEEVWYNFSQPVWRLRVGELLFAEQDDLSNERETPSDRDLLLLQITLAAELLLRLDALHDLAKQHKSSPAISEDDREVTSVVPTLKIQWDLVLAQRFLDNLDIFANVQDGINKTTNRASLFSANSFFTAKTSARDSDPAVEPVFHPKRAEKQLDGLVHFAEAICWPHAREVKDLLVPTLSVDEAVVAEVKGLQPPERRASRMSGLSVYATPLSSPTLTPPLPDLPEQYAVLAASTKNGSDASFLEQKPCKLLSRSRVISEHKVQLQPAGLPKVGGAFRSMNWLSRSWLSGLVLPGDSAGHLLLGGLLENSPDALRILGDVAYLQDGFQYAEYVYWSKKNVLGRVLAPSKGAKECIGWISLLTERMLKGSEIKDGWIRLDVKDAPSSDVVRSRIQDHQAVASDSDPLCGLETGKLQAGDFVWPLDGPPVMGNEVKYHGLSLRERSISGQRLSSATDLTKQFMAEGSNSAPGQKKPESSVAKLTFGSPINSKLAKLELLILYDVQFITSYPCHPQSARSLPNSRPLSIIKCGSKAASSVAGSEDLASTDSVRALGTTQPNAHSSGYTFSLKNIEKELPPPPAHALHINYTFEVVPVATLLSAYPESKPRAVSRAEERPKTAVAEEVVVLDCRGTEDLELLARAWCAKVGENALVGKSGRTCLACCVREARALGVCVVIRT